MHTAVSGRHARAYIYVHRTQKVNFVTELKNHRTSLLLQLIQALTTGRIKRSCPNLDTLL